MEKYGDGWGMEFGGVGPGDQRDHRSLWNIEITYSSSPEHKYS